MEQEYINNKIKDKLLSEQLHLKIKNKLFSKQLHLKDEINYYFKHRHKGLAGIDSEQTKLLIKGTIRELKVWKQMNSLVTTKNYI